MNQQYRYQRYYYDLTRKYYLLGRDSLLESITLRPGETTLEIGCGTARNLCYLAKRYPDHVFYGLDAATVMLDTAQKMASNACFRHIHLHQGFAERWHYQDFGLEKPFDHIIFSYSLSMIPDWPAALKQALNNLAAPGFLHIVDFSLQRPWPAWARLILKHWLKHFNVNPQPGLIEALRDWEVLAPGELQYKTCYGDYALQVHFKKTI